MESKLLFAEQLAVDIMFALYDEGIRGNSPKVVVTQKRLLRERLKMEIPDISEQDLDRVVEGVFST